MYTLKSDALTVSVLDPVADRERLGTRYCTGGYIFAVADAEHGDLLSGPTYPDSFNTFDGQGIPDAFNLDPLTGVSSPRTTGVQVPTDGLALILGIGTVSLTENKVTAWCDWEIEAGAAIVQMKTHHSFRGYEVELQKTVRVAGRTVRAEVFVHNQGRPLAFRWFPHPFYPQPDTDELVKFNIPLRFPENEGYEMGTDGFIRRKGKDWTVGYYQALDHDAAEKLVVIQKHPKLGLVTAMCSYVPDFFPIWGNARTFSWEPFFERSVAPGQSVTWWIDYDF
jgi:hypothetical protein